MKADRLPQEAGLKLLSTPKPPDNPIALEYSVIPLIHDDWPIYFAGVRRRLRKKII